MITLKQLRYLTALAEHRHFGKAAEACAVTQPALVMDGGDSPDWARNACRALADALPNAEYRTLDGQTHEVAPEVLAPELDRFFSG